MLPFRTQINTFLALLMLHYLRSQIHSVHKVRFDLRSLRSVRFRMFAPNAANAETRREQPNLRRVCLTET